MTQVSVQQALRTALRHHHAGELPQAEAIYRQVLAAEPNNAHALHLLGTLANQCGQSAAAVELIAKSIQLSPQNAEAYGNLSAALLAIGQIEPAEQASRRAVELQPTLAEAWLNRAATLHALNRFEESIACAERALSLRPNLAQAHVMIGAAREEMHEFDQAIASHHRALAIDPKNAPAHAGIGSCLQLQGFVVQGARHYEQAIQLNPKLAKTRMNLAGALQSQGKIESAIEQYRRVIELTPAWGLAHSGLLLAMNYHAGLSAREIFEAHAKWGSNVEARIAALKQSRCADERPLRIGYVSQDFRRHSVLHFLEPLLEHHDRERFEIFCYSDVRRNETDECTIRCQGYGHVWRDVLRMDDGRLAAQIREDGIDILVDLSGHTAWNRLGVFALKPAPMQISYLGYPNTTGLTRMDYRITDAVADPPGDSDRLHTEKLIRLERCAWCYRPPEKSPDVAELPAQQSGFITFGSLNNVAKISRQVMTLWSRVLMAVPQSRLLIKSPSLRDPDLQTDLLAQLAAAGIDAGRVELLGFTFESAEHLATYNRIDIALDTFPYNGTTTTCDALWMGVPVITLSGDRHASRVSASLVSAMGFHEWIARSEDDYVAIAVALSSDLVRLAEIRRTLRDTMRASSLCDGAELTRAIERQYVDAIKHVDSEPSH